MQYRFHHVKPWNYEEEKIEEVMFNKEKYFEKSEVTEVKPGSNRFFYWIKAYAQTMDL